MTGLRPASARALDAAMERRGGSPQPQLPGPARALSLPPSLACLRALSHSHSRALSLSLSLSCARALSLFAPVGASVSACVRAMVLVGDGVTQTVAMACADARARRGGVARCVGGASGGACRYDKDVWLVRSFCLVFRCVASPCAPLHHQGG